jgi:ketosteroid isomerase-like protein
MKGIVDGSMAYNTIRQVFILRKNEEGHWKIYGYKNEEETGDIQ